MQQEKGDLVMKKRVLQDYELKNAVKIADGSYTLIIRLKNGDILKIFEPSILEASKIIGSDVEKKVLAAKPLKKSPEILIPKAAYYDKNGNFIGYTIPEAKGINYNDYQDSFTITERLDLKKYAKDHSKIESVVRRNSDIVFPDLCTCDNIFIDSKGNIQFIDYDGLQIGEYNANSISTTLGNPLQYIESKKYYQNSRFTKELDKRSSIFLYFITAFNIDLSKVGQINPFTGKRVTIEDIFTSLDFHDQDICHKIWKLFQENEDNEYLGDDVFRIAEEYKLKIVGKTKDTFLKQLIKK